MQVSHAADPSVSDDVPSLDGSGVPAGQLRQELRANLAVAGFSLGLSVVVAVGLALLMTMLG